MGHQFIHVEAYGLNGGKTKDGGTKRSIRQILNEVVRKPGSIPHIENPEKPEIIFGCEPEEIEAICQNYAENTRDEIGRKFRKDGLILLAGVASLPREREEDFEKFSDEVVSFLKEKYGDRLKSVVTHNDEAHPHIHFYAVPEVGEKLEDIHEGYKAAKVAKLEGKLKGEQNQAYKKAMRGFQDNFSKKVAIKFGLTRLGPGVRRLSRKAWIAEQKQAEFFANAKAVAKKGYKDGLKKGTEKARKEFEIENNRVGEKLGGVLSGVLAGLHKPSINAQNQVKEAQRRVEEVEKKRVEEVARAKHEADRRVVAIATDLKKFKDQVKMQDKELEEIQKKMQEQAEKLAVFENKFGKPAQSQKLKF
jgi:hypothetical protein